MIGVSFLYTLYFKNEKWIDKKLYYRKVKYITSNTENIYVLHI